MDPDSVDPKAPLFSIPGFFVAFGAKGTPDSDPGRSPTSPLDFGVFGGLFSPRSSPRSGHRNKWFSDKVGLSLLSSTIGQGHCDSFTRDNVVLAPQIKLDPSSQVFDPSSQVFDPCVNKYAAAEVIAEEHTSPRRSSSSPMDIISSQAYSRSLSGRDMALSEDYTCIISHGPNPKTTHIFGDCILECDPKELGKEETDSFSRLCLCTGDCQKSNHIHREVSAEKEGVGDLLEISGGSSDSEDLFPMAMPLKPRP